MHILSLCTLCLHPFLFLPAYFPPHASMSGWASSKDIHYQNTGLIPPLNLLLSPSFLVSLPPPYTYSPNPTPCLFFFFLRGKISHSRAQGRGRLWIDGSHFCPVLGEKQFICPDPQYNFPQILTRRASVLMNNKQSLAQGREFTLPLSPLCFLTLDLRAASESSTEFIANFWGDPLCGLDLSRDCSSSSSSGDERTVNRHATIEQQSQTEMGAFFALKG